ncbi:MAG: hypothetical protein AAFO95_15000 [Cyanobacteria bacterium J06600_6]
MSLTNVKEDREEIVIAFNQLLKRYQQNQSRIATKEEEVAKVKNRALVAKTVDYTVDNIVNGMASLQLVFGNVVGELAERLANESYKLEELKKAIAVEREHLERLEQVRLVADTIYILDQEQEAKTATLTADTAKNKAQINQEIITTQQKWQIEQAEFQSKAEETSASFVQKRAREAADYEYELERQRTIEQDEYETDRRLQEIAIAELETAKNKDWSEREKYLQSHKREFTEHQEAIAGFETKLNEEYNQAKGKAIKEADGKHKVAAELKEKEWSATKQGYELKIASLTTVVEHQTEQIGEIAAQLQEVNTQAQNLAMQAFQNQ